MERSLRHRDYRISLQRKRAGCTPSSGYVAIGSIPPETLRQYAGRYRSSAMAEMIVTVEGPELVLQTRSYRGPLVSVTDSYFEGNFGSVRFNLAVTPATLEFSGAGGTALYVLSK